MNHPKNERTLVILKPDAVQRGLIGEIIKRIERTGLKLVSLKFSVASEDQCWTHYNKDNAWFLEKGEITVKNRKEMNLPIEKEAIEYGKDIVKALVDLMTSGPIVPMIWEGNQAVGVVKKIVGGTEPMSSDVGTIRGDYTIDSYEIANLGKRAVRNLIHCSDKPEEALREIDIWFKKEEILDYSSTIEQILYNEKFSGFNK